MKVDGKVAIVTGASSGVGRELARLFLSKGCRVVLAGRRSSKLHELKLAAESPGNALVAITDMSQSESVGMLVREAVDAFGTLDIVVNNAAVAYGGSIADLSVGEIDYAIKVNLIGPMLLTRAALPVLAQRPESMVVNVSSLSGLVPVPYQSVYCASKFGLRGFSESLRRESLSTRVRVLTVYPAGVESDLWPESVRTKASDLNMKLVNLMPARAAAEHILRAMHANRKELVFGSASEQLLSAMNRWFPSIVDRIFGQRLGEVHELMLAQNENCRRRDRRDSYVRSLALGKP